VAQIALGGALLAAGEGRTTVHAEWEGLSSANVGVDVAAKTDGRPDLEVSALSAVGAGGIVTLSATVHNRGAASAVGFFVDVFVDPFDAPMVGDIGDDFTHVEYLGPDGSVELPFTVPSDDGLHEIWILVDSEGVVDELDEGNNATSAAVDVGGAAESGPNLVIYGFDYVADDASIYYVVDVFNAGTEDAGTFFVDVYLNQSSEPAFPSDGDAYTMVEGLAAGGIAGADFLVDRTCDLCRSWVLVDSYDEVVESNELDNAGGPIVVGGADTGWWGDTGY
jgi:subtilase family serine protease